MNLSVQIFVSLVLSVVVGLFLGDAATGPVKTWIAPVGTMFINLIKMMIVPVVLCSLIVGMTSMGDMKKLGRIGIILTKTCIMLGASLTFGAASEGSAIPIPGSITPATENPMTIAIAVVTI